MRKQLFDPAGRLRRQPLEHVADVGVKVELVELGRVDQANDGGGALAGTQASGEQPVLPPQCDRPDAVLHPVVVDRQIAVVDEALYDALGGDAGREVLNPVAYKPLDTYSRQRAKCRAPKPRIGGTMRSAVALVLMLASSIAAAETVNVKYHGPVSLDAFA